MNVNRRYAITLLFALLTMVAATAISGCGGASEEDLQKAREQGAQEQRDKDAQEEQQKKQKELEKKINKLEKEAKKKDNSSSSGSSNNGGSAPGPTHYCSSGLGAASNTTCAFAENVRSEWASAGGGTVSIDVYSPATSTTYRMHCVDGPTTVCRGGNNAVVYIY